MNKIENIIVIVSLVAMPLCARGQVRYEVEHQKESGDVAPSELRSSVYVGGFRGGHCFLKLDEGRAAEVRVVDSVFEDVGSAEVAHASRYDLLSVGRSDEKHVALLMADARGHREASLMGARVALDSLQKIHPMELHHFEFERGDRFHAWGASSKSGQYMAAVVVVEYVQRKLYDAYIALYDSGMQKVWEHNYPLATIDEVYVTDDGRVVTLGVEQSGFDAELVFNVFSEEGSLTRSFAAGAGYVQQMEIANVVGDRMLVVGTFGPAHIKNREQLCGGLYGAVYDIEKGRLVRSTVRRFQSEDVLTLYNRDLADSLTTSVVDNVRFAAVEPTGYGALVAVSRGYGISGVSDEPEVRGDQWRSEGLHCVAFDMDAKVRWQRNIRHSVQVDTMYGAAVAGIASGEEVHIVSLEHAKDALQYEVRQGARLCRPGNKSRMALYTITSQGEVEKTTIENKCSAIPMGLYDTESPNSLLLLSARGKKTRATTIKIR